MCQLNYGESIYSVLDLISFTSAGYKVSEAHEAPGSIHHMTITHTHTRIYGGLNNIASV